MSSSDACLRLSLWRSHTGAIIAAGQTGRSPLWSNVGQRHCEAELQRLAKRRCVGHHASHQCWFHPSDGRDGKSHEAPQSPVASQGTLRQLAHAPSTKCTRVLLGTNRGILGDDIDEPEQAWCHWSRMIIGWSATGLSHRIASHLEGIAAARAPNGKGKPINTHFACARSPRICSPSGSREPRVHDDPMRRLRGSPKATGALRLCRNRRQRRQRRRRRLLASGAAAMYRKPHVRRLQIAGTRAP